MHANDNRSQVLTAPRPSPALEPRMDWGTAALFLARACCDETVAEHWTRNVARPAHRMGHPVAQAGCPGCRYETAVMAANR
jgi:hypothetical protein